MIAFTLSNIREEFSDFWVKVEFGSNPSALGIIEVAATNAMVDAGDALKAQGRAAIAAGGLSKKWQNAWRVNVYPKTGTSLDPSAYGYHNIPYSPIFQTGGVINAKRGLLWLALPTVPKVGKKIATPRQLVGVKLFSINRSGHKPLLAAKIRLSGTSKTSSFRGRATLPQLRAGTNADRIRETSRLKAKQRGGVKASNAGARIATVPLFVGVPSVSIRKRFDLARVANAVGQLVPSFYEQNLKT